ncbi:hypothetical protein LY90DRAFT_678575 [Neocallimastix californiae]|uniref:PSI domain-containing protein n=1 Tax=Neocallimastix californiae TaxID=1754190 RepID=A0A1Y1YYP5_9FUNG|nr:hypothetical protein LY90DRAFT_678575 [Neocallimastix californiae]|eukprot:ORY03163.1 hypothetical protein LY90DRAFT_678575 [Neocallimastix californiae]
MFKHYLSIKKAFLFILLSILNNIFAQDVSTKNNCHRLNEATVCNAATQSGCSWCSTEWGSCIKGDTDCYKIMSDSELIQPFFFYLSSRSNMVCHLQHTNEYSRLHNIHCDALCRKALMNDFGYCQFYDDNGKEFTDFNINGAIEKKSFSPITIILIISAVILACIIFAIIFKVYVAHHNKILNERRKIELEDSKLENDRNLEAQIAQYKIEIEERQKLNGN